MALQYPTQPGDIDHLIADEHAVVDHQFQHLEAGCGNRRVLVDPISFELANAAQLRGDPTRIGIGGESVGGNMAPATVLSWMAMHAFEGRPEAATDPRINLLGWSHEQLAQQPPTMVITDERDVLRSQGQQWAQELEAAGVSTEHRYYVGVMHEFFGATAVLDEAEQAQQEAARHLRAAFDTSMTVAGAGR